MLISDIQSHLAFENVLEISLLGNIWNDKFRKSLVLLNKLVAVVTPDILGDQGDQE